MVRNFRIGYWIPERKCQKSAWIEFHQICQQNGFELIKIKLDQALEEQGPFQVFIHKITDFMAAADHGDVHSEKIVAKIQHYLKTHPEIVVIDPIENVRKVMDRFVSYTIASSLDLSTNNLFIPNFMEINTTENLSEIQLKLKKTNITYPFICKPILSYGSDSAHKMSIIFNETHLSDLEPPCVVQSFINHNAILYKIFVVGQTFRILQRSSLKNFYASENRKTIFFRSKDISKTDSNSHLSVLDANDLHSLKFKHSLDDQYIEQIVKSLRSALQMQLFGFDIIIENCSGKYAIIDINNFPSYDGFPNYTEHLINCIKDMLKNSSGGS